VSILNDLVRVKPEDLFEFSMKALESVGVKEKDAKIIAENITLANLRGVDSHGVVRLPSYVRRVMKKLIDPLAPVETVKNHGSTALIDANNNFGQVAAMRATLLAAEKSREFGVAAVGVRNANHFGMAAHYALKLTEQKLIAIVLSNGPPAISPWGGKIPMLGSTPICIGFPIEKDDSIILDMAVSTVARGKIRLAAMKGEKIPEGWAFDDEGNPTTDPKAAIRGTLTPIGGPKGYGLAISADILCGLLMSSAFGKSVKALDDFNGLSGTGFFIEAINVEFFLPYLEYQNSINNYVREIKESPKRKGVEEIFLPGEIERKETELRKKLGIPLDTETLAQIKNLAKELNIPSTL
jgi:LDH2 family malate/lactate/ureidoglycolate dehydrogenase